MSQLFLHSLPKEDLLELLAHLSTADKRNDARIEEWFRKKTRTPQQSEQLFWDRWSEFQDLMPELEEREANEAEAVEILSEILYWLMENELSQESRLRFLREAVESYQAQYEFSPLLIDLIFESVQEKDEWIYLTKSMEADQPQKWLEALLDIYKNYLVDEEKWLTLRKQNLLSSEDYEELVEYYVTKNQPEKAVEYAVQGIQNPRGDNINLLNFIASHYIERQEEEKLLSIFTQSTGSHTGEVLDWLVQYFEADENQSMADWVSLHQIQLKTGNHLIKKAERIAPQFPDDCFQFFWHQCTNYLHAGQIHEADACLKKAEHIFPQTQLQHNWQQQLQQLQQQDVRAEWLEQLLS